MGCIYLATNQINGKRYVGQTIDFDNRKNGHKKSASKGITYLFYKAIRKYGFDYFDWEILYNRERLSPEKDKAAMNRWERYYIKKLNTMVPNGYNMTEGGDGNTNPSLEERIRRGVTYKKTISRPEIHKKFLLACKLGNSTPTARKNHSAAAKLCQNRPDVKEKMRNVNSRPDVKKRRRDAAKKIWDAPGYRARMRKIMKLTQNRPEVKAQQHAAHCRPDVLTKSREATKQQFADPEARKIHSMICKIAQNKPGVQAKRKIALTKPGVQAKRVASRRKNKLQKENKKCN